MSGRSHKICKALCDKCAYEMNISAGYGNTSNLGKFCGYMLITSNSRCFKNGQFIEDSDKYCEVYEPREGNKRATSDTSPHKLLIRRKGNV